MSRHRRSDLFSLFTRIELYLLRVTVLIVFAVDLFKFIVQEVSSLLR
jgi:hypothetical protein